MRDSGTLPLVAKYRASNLEYVGSARLMGGNNVRAWISTDARRLPVRLQADLPVGNFALALRSAQ